MISCNAGRGKKLIGPRWLERWSEGEQGLQMGHVGSPLSPSLPESPVSRHSTSESGSAAKLKPVMLAGLCCVPAAEPAQQSLVTQVRFHAQLLCIPILSEYLPAATAHVTKQRQIPLTDLYHRCFSSSISSVRRQRNSQAS